MELSICGCKKFVCESFGGNMIVNAHSGGNMIVNAHSGAKKAHDWAVEQLADLFRTTHRVKTQQVAKSRGQRCGDIQLQRVCTLLMQQGRCHWCWTYILRMNVREVALTLVLMGIYITR